jgi:integrase
MGRNIRFLKADLEPFRATFKQEVGVARPRRLEGRVFRKEDSRFWWMAYRDRHGERQRESTNTEDKEEAHRVLRERLQARDANTLPMLRKGERITLSQWSVHFLEGFSKPPIRAAKTHLSYCRVVKHVNAQLGDALLVDLTADMIESYLRRRLDDRVEVRRKAGKVSKGLVKPSTVHQEYRVLRRMLNVAVRKKLLVANPCSGVEFPVRVKGLFRPHYVTWSEQQRIEQAAPAYLRNVIRIITETGLRVYKELAPMKRTDVDLENAVVWIPDSKTASGVAEVPLTDLAVEAFRNQMAEAGAGEYLFPNADGTGFQASFKKVWGTTLRKAGVPYFRIYDLRSTYATRLSAGGVADEWVTQLLRQGDAKVFKKYSQMKLQMKREALLKLNRKANDKSSSGTGEAA